MMRAALVAAALAAPPTARQAVEDEALVRALVTMRLAPLVAEWRGRAAGDATLARRLDLALFEIASDADPPAERLERAAAARRMLVAQATESRDPRRAAWALDLATDLLVGWPAADGRVATLAVGVATPGAIESWRAGLDEAEAVLEIARAALAETPRGPLALPAARAFRLGLEPRLAALEATANGTRALLDGHRPEGLPDAVPDGAEWNDLALLSALERGIDRLRAVAGDPARGPWTILAAECAIDLADGDARGRTRLAERAAGLAKGRAPALALLAADAAVRADAGGDRGRFAAWENLLDATPPARRGATRAAIFPRLQSLPPSGPPATMGDLELAIRSMAEPCPEDVAAAIDARPATIESGREAPRLLAFARLRRLAARGELDAAAALAESLATGLGDDPIASAAAETLVLVRSALASASTSDAAARAEREALALAIERFPKHPQRHRWAIDLALARLRAGDPAGALAAVRTVPDAAPSGREARAVEAFALVRTGDDASLARAEAIVQGASGDDATVAARIALVQALRLARDGRPDDARASADAVVADPALPGPVRADALALALELGATPPPHAARDIVAAQPWARGPLLAALPGAAAEAPRLTRLLSALEGSLDLLDPDERLAVAEATLATGAAPAAAALASEVIAAAPGSPTALAATLVKARALRATGGDAAAAEAFTLARDVARQAPQASPAWWEANALQLEILEASGRNRDQVLPWVNRLKSVDPALGGAAVRARIEAVAGKVRSGPSDGSR